MPGNSTGEIFRLTSFGESHGIAIGGIIEGCPAGLSLDAEQIQLLLDRRRPGQSELTTSRDEHDIVQFLSGIYEGTTLGTPIGFLIKNKDTRSSDYDELKDVFRPSHADYSWYAKYGIRDHRGGGRSSARETACRVVAGGIAMQLLKYYGITIDAWVSRVGNIAIAHNEEVNKELIYTNDVRCPDESTAAEMIKLINQVKKEGDSIGGMISCSIINVPAGLGEPVFNKLHASLGKAMLGINAVKAFEIGSGFSSNTMRGSEHNDEFVKNGAGITTKTNHSGGIQGGISNGNEIFFNVAFKPVSTILKQQQTLDTKGENISFSGKGRHDPCVAPRAVPIVQSMAALTIADYLLLNRLSRL
jgi:chorismate synthase